MATKAKAKSTKTVIRSIYANKKAAFTLAQLVTKCNMQLAKTVKVNTVETAIIDLKNPKWACGELLVLQRNVKKQYVIAAKVAKKVVAKKVVAKKVVAAKVEEIVTAQ